MDAELAVNQVLEDEGLTSDLEEAEATLLTRWLVREVETIASRAVSDNEGWKQIKAKKQQARKITRAVSLFRDEGQEQASAYARKEQLPWPSQPVNTAQQVMEHLLQAMK